MTLEEIVHENLRNAQENGYFTSTGTSLVLIAEDMMEFSSDLAEFTLEDIIPHVKSFFGAT